MSEARAKRPKSAAGLAAELGYSVRKAMTYAGSFRIDHRLPDRLSDKVRELEKILADRTRTGDGED